ncbi:MAG TPA: GNAT family N-acetyltransferase [Actinoplanes sp.]|nr:GNAT family N-acetyltransferase [Actinoplanes sp.]
MSEPAELDDLVELATACRRADGGLPLTAEPAFLAGRWGSAGATTRYERGPDGALVAAAVLRDGPRLMTLVHPSVRGRGVEAELLDWGLGLAPGATVETESSTAERERLYASRGLRRTFGEDVLRYDLSRAVPAPAWPDGVTLAEWSAASGERFHGVYHAAFRERPGYPGWPAADWIEAVTEEDTFRPAWSLLATDDRLGDAGFITAAVGWIDQVGVVPAARGRGLGAALVLEVLRRMRVAGETEAWLAVNVDNPAGALYRRLGFEGEGRRARFQRAEPPAAAM